MMNKASGSRMAHIEGRKTTSTTTKPTTRRDVLVSKLQIAEMELKKAKEQNDRLLSEQDDHEEEIKRILNKYQALKSELADYDIQLEDMRGERDQLQSTVDQLHHCQEIHTEALLRIKDLEHQLEEAHLKLDSNLNTSLSDQSCNTRLRRYEKLYESLECVENLGSNISHVSNMEDKSSDECSNILIRGSNRIKKYRKINRQIIKTKKMLKNNKRALRACFSRSKNIALTRDLLLCQNLLETQSDELYGKSNRIKDLERSLNDISTKYSQCCSEKRRLETYINQLVDVGNENIQQFDSLVRKCLNTDNSVEIAQKSSEGIELEPTYAVVPAPLRISHSAVLPNLPIPAPQSPPPSPVPAVCASEQSDASCSSYECKGDVTPPSPPAPPHASAAPTQDHDSCVRTPIRKTVLYTDRVGIGLGVIMHDLLNQVVVNNCMPETSLKRISEQIAAESFDEHSTLVVYLSDSSNVNKHYLSVFTETIIKISNKNIGKIIVCAFPYSNTLSLKRNNDIYYLNLILHRLAVYHNKVSYFDTNKFIEGSFVLTREYSHLPRKYIFECAKLLAYNIDPVISSITKDTPYALSFISARSGDSAEPGDTAPAAPTLTLNLMR
jgi:hypothetical protein